MILTVDYTDDGGHAMLMAPIDNMLLMMMVLVLTLMMMILLLVGDMP